MSLTKDTVVEQLKTIKGPDFEGDIVSLGLVSDIFIADCEGLLLDHGARRTRQGARAAARRRRAGGESHSGRHRCGGGADRREKGWRHGRAGPAAARPAPARQAVPRHRLPPAQERSRRSAACRGSGTIIAVASGKGGVGKSTTAVNIALGLKAHGLKVGMLDADIYGPSMPRLLNIHGRPQTVDGKVLRPMENYGLKVMSMGFLVDEETPMIWRGPMVMSALTQMLREVEWGPLDILVVDMPPGTGDAQLTMAQQVPLAGAVIVSTPQDLALIDARKGLNMFKKVDVPLLGIIENMSYFIAPDTGKRYDIFGHGGARKEAERLGVAFLGEVPLVMGIRETSDTGMPVVASEPDGVEAKTYRDIAARVWDRVREEHGAAEAAVPAIVFE